MTTWQCAACRASKRLQSDPCFNGAENIFFFSVQEFSDHLKSEHALIKNVNGPVIYVCRYGPSGVCRSQNHESASDGFYSLREFERHLISTHLKESISVSHSMQLSLGSSSFSPRNRWSVYQSVVNLPAVLNDPTCRETDIFSRTWGEQFERAEVLPSPRLPEVTEKHFEQYLKKLQGVTSISRHGHTTPIENIVLRAVRNAAPPRNFPSSTQVLVSDGFPISRVTSLEFIAPMFFESDFNLQQPQTFSQVIPLHPRSSGLASLQSITTDKSRDKHGDSILPVPISPNQQERDFRLQHDRLTHYLDIVEVHLAEQVSKKSSIFFEAVCCHDVVQEQLRTALEHIKRVRDKLAQVNSSVTCAVMKLHRLVRRRANCRLLLDKLKVVASLQAAQPTIQLLLRSNDFCAALDLVSSTQELLLQFTSGELVLPSKDRSHTQWNTPMATPERQLACLRHLHAQLAEISRFVRHMIEAEFEAALRQFLASRPVENQYSGPDLVPCLLGLLHIKRHDFVSAFRAELLRQMKTIQSNRADDSDSETGMSLKDQLRTWSNAKWIDLMTKKCFKFRELLSRANEAIEIFSLVIRRASITSSSDPPMSPMLLQKETVCELNRQLCVAIQTACEAAQKHLTDLVSLRNRLTLTEPFVETSGSQLKANDVKLRASNPPRAYSPGTGENALDRLSSDEFFHLVGVLEEFQEFLFHLLQKNTRLLSTWDSMPPNEQAMGTICNSIAPLARMLLNLTRNYIQRFHYEHVTKLEIILNQERWQGVSVPNHVQELVNRTFVNMLRNGSKRNTGSPLIGTHLLDTDQSQSSVDDSVSSNLNFDGEKFVVVGTVLLLLPMILDYVTLAPRMPCQPGSVAELAGRLDDLLNSFNSRTCQLVLGAEARKAADLSTISARNLALASRNVQLIARCVPLLQTYFCNLLNKEPEIDHATHPLYDVLKDKHQSAPLVHIESLFNEHIDQINDKLFNLLSNRIQDRLRAWSVRPPTPSRELQAICRAFTRMVEMISDVLPRDIIAPIILRAHSEFKSQLRHRLRELNVAADGGPLQSLVHLELSFYATQLRSLSLNLYNIEDDFSDVWPSC